MAYMTNGADMTRTRLNGEGSIYRRGDGRYFYSRTLWVDGKRIRKTVSARTRDALLPKKRALDKALDAGVTGDGGMTVETWLNHWHANIAPATARKPRTLDGYRSYLDTWLIPHLGRHRLDRLAPAHIRALWAAMESAGRSNATMRQADAILSRALRVAEEDGKISKNPCAASSATPPAGKKGSHGKLTTDEAHKVVLAAARRPDAARWFAAVLLGMRQGEVLGLHWRDVDLDAGTIHVHESQSRVKGRGLVVGTVKSAASDRIVPAGALPPVLEAIRAMPGPRTGLVWGPKDNKADWRDWRALLAEANVEPRSLHSARATTASVLTEYGVPSGTIAEILGHSDKRVTEDHYIHSDPGSRFEALGRLSPLLAEIVVGEVVDPPLSSRSPNTGQPRP